MNILITGADSYIGRNLIPRLLINKNRLFLIGGEFSYLSDNYSKVDFIFSHKDLDPTKIEMCLTEFKPDIVVHLAGYVTSKDSEKEAKKLYEANLLFLNKIIEYVKNSDLKAFLYTGSSTEFNDNDNTFNPTYLYSATKSAGRHILKYFSDVYNFKQIIITPYNVYGIQETRIKLFDYLYASFSSKEKIKVTKCEQVLDFIYITDLINLYEKIISNIDYIPNGSDFKAGTGTGISVLDVIYKMEKIIGKKANLDIGGFEYRPKDAMVSIADVSLQEELLNWQAQVGIDKGLKLYIEGKNND